MSSNPDQPVAPRTSGLATWSLVLGILSFGCLFLTGVPAMLLGLFGLRAIARSGGALRGTGLAVTGLILGILGTVIGIPVAVFGGWIGTEINAEMKSANHLRQIALAIHNHHDTHLQFPKQAIGLPGSPLLSWRVAVLPYLGETALYRQFNLNEPWDGPTNKPLLQKMPQVYKHPGISTDDPTLTYYQVFTNSHPGGVQGGLIFSTPFTSFTNLNTVADGTTNTIMVAEAAKPVPWTKPEDISYDPKGPLPELGGRFPQYFLAAMADASIARINKTASPEKIRAAITAAGGEIPSQEVILPFK